MHSLRRSTLHSSPRSQGFIPQGFTLIEMLIMLGIVLLLAALLFPVLGRARENAKRTKCQNNLKQISLGLLQYAGDHNRRFPVRPPDDDPGDSGWAFTLSEYVRNDDIFQCPSESYKQDDGFTDYWFNAALLGAHEIRVRNPASTIMNGDGDGGSLDYVLGKDTPDPSEEWQVSGDYARRHLDGANYAFVDGHVKWLNPDAVSKESPNSATFTLAVN